VNAKGAHNSIPQHNEKRYSTVVIVVISRPNGQLIHASATPKIAIHMTRSPKRSVFAKKHA
jgi:hypothetical protein